METPNTDYINKLAGDDEDFRAQFISIIKEEFPVEKGEYLNYFNNNELKKAAEVVHKIKHKFNILGMTQAYGLAVDFEEDLKVGKTQLSQDFDAKLVTVENYIKEM
ncbi:MAG: Hpt domain-containing protein [Flavobacteriaceae bacterium]